MTMAEAEKLAGLSRGLCDGYQQSLAIHKRFASDRQDMSRTSYDRRTAWSTSVYSLMFDIVHEALYHSV
jgi:hypothetical protein